MILGFPHWHVRVTGKLKWRFIQVLIGRYGMCLNWNYRDRIVSGLWLYDHKTTIQHRSFMTAEERIRWPDQFETWTKILSF